MPNIKVLPHADYCPEGVEVSAFEGMSICEVLLANHIPIEHTCNMNCACATCHVIVREGFSSLEEAQDKEADLLDRAWGLQAQSRLSCQVLVAQHDLVIEIPKYSVNHAKENH